MSDRDDDTRRFLPAPGAVYFAPDPDAVHDQGDEPASHPCPACIGGWHGEHCQGEFWTTGQPPELVDCDCIEGACRGEWIEVGYTTDPSPVGTPPPDWSQGPPLGPPIPVLRQETRPDGHYVEVSIGPAHPAYAALRDGLTDHLSSADVAVDGLSDNGDSVKSRSGSGRPPAVTDGVPLPSATVSGLGPAEIARRRHVPPPQAIGLGDVVAGLFGARLTGDPDEPVAEVVTPVPNRADRRRAARGRRRG